MPHAGALYDMPEIPVEILSESSDEDDSDDEEQTFPHRGDQGTVDLIAEQAAEAIINAQLPKLIEMVRNDIKENGLKALRKWYPTI
jgi:cell division ATPase FtsA